MLHPHPFQPTRAGRAYTTIAALALAAVLILAGCSADLAGMLHPAPTVAATPVAPLARPHMVASLLGISLVAPNVGWIVGRDDVYGGLGAFLLQEDHGGWRLVPFPAVVNAQTATPTSIAMVSADTGWIALTLAPNFTPVILHESAGRWTAEQLPAGSGIVTVLAAPTPTDAWALSLSSDPASGAMTSAILRDRGGQWVAEATFPGVSLAALAMAAPDDGWAVGSDGAGPVLLHDVRGAWARVTPAALGGVAALTSVALASASVGWATGLAPAPVAHCTECGDGQAGRVLLRLRDGAWQQVQEQNGGAEDLPYTSASSEHLLPDSVAAGADGSGWIARKQLVRVAADGQQQVFTATCKSDFLGLALVPAAAAGSAPEGWIIGSYGQLFHLAGGALTRYDTGAPCDPLAT